jgi:hypothetical protein
MCLSSCSPCQTELLIAETTGSSTTTPLGGTGLRRHPAPPSDLKNRVPCRPENKIDAESEALGLRPVRPDRLEVGRHRNPKSRGVRKWFQVLMTTKGLYCYIQALHPSGAKGGARPGQLKGRQKRRFKKQRGQPTHIHAQEWSSLLRVPPPTWL